MCQEIDRVNTYPSTIATLRPQKKIWRPFEEFVDPVPTPVTTLDPNWCPFPVRSRSELEALEDILRRSFEHRLALVNFFRRNRGIPEAGHQTFLKGLILCEAVVHLDSFRHLQATLLFNLIVNCWFEKDHAAHLKITTQNFYRLAKARFIGRQTAQKRRAAEQTEEPQEKRSRVEVIYVID